MDAETWACARAWCDGTHAECSVKYPDYQAVAGQRILTTVLVNSVTAKMADRAGEAVTRAAAPKRKKGGPKGYNPQGCTLEQGCEAAGADKRAAAEKRTQAAEKKAERKQAKAIKDKAKAEVEAAKLEVGQTHMRANRCCIFVCALSPCLWPPCFCSRWVVRHPPWPCCCLLLAAGACAEGSCRFG